MDVELAGKKVSVEYNSENVDVQKIKDKIEDAGYRVI